MERKIKYSLWLSVACLVAAPFASLAASGEKSGRGEVYSKIDSVHEPFQVSMLDSNDTIPRGDILTNHVAVSDTLLPKQVFTVEYTYLQELPLRSLIETTALEPGIFQRDGSIYIKGSLPDQNRFIVDGTDITNIFYGGLSTHITPDAIKETRILTGGYPAENGGAIGGIVSADVQTGSQKLNASLQMETDNYTKQGKSLLGSYSYGYSDYVTSLSGPIVSNTVRFFVIAENEFYRDPGIVGGTIVTPLYWNGLDYRGLVADPQFTLTHPNSMSRDTLNLDYPAGNRIGGQFDDYSYTGTILFDLGSVRIRTSGSYSRAFSQDEAGIEDVFDMQRLPVNKYENGFGNLRLTNYFSPQTFFNFNLNYHRNFNQAGLDPKLLADFTSYGSPASDPLLNNGGSTLMNSPWYFFGPSGAGGLSIYQSGTLLATNPAMTSETSIGTRLDFTTITGQNKLKFGGEYTYSTVRHYSTNSVTSIYSVMNNNSLTSAQKESYLRNIASNNYGYDILGNTINTDVVVGSSIVAFGPPHPITGAAYIQDEIQLSDVEVNIGLRYDFFNPDSWTFANPDSIDFVDSLGVFSAKSLVKTAVTQQISPRLAVSFRASDRTMLYARYGKFIQEPPLSESYFGAGFGNFYSDTVGYGLKPERSTLYELALSQAISENAALNVTAFYKEMEDMVQFVVISPSPGAMNRSYPALVNGGTLATGGIEFNVGIQRTHRAAADMNFTLSDAEYSPAAWGNLSIDYRFKKGDGGEILERSGIDLLFQYTSGYPYAILRSAIPSAAPQQVSQGQPLTSSFKTPALFEIDARIDKTFPVGPLNVLVYMYGVNLLNTREAESLFSQTGDPSDDGWLNSLQGEEYAASTSDPSLYQNLYRSAYLGSNSGNYARPRQIRFGIKIDY
jgi:outer membrane receptor protein involved in Fe transport